MNFRPAPVAGRGRLRRGRLQEHRRPERQRRLHSIPVAATLRRIRGQMCKKERQIEWREQDQAMQNSIGSHACQGLLVLFQNEAEETLDWLQSCQRISTADR
jgi:hypothetical protein